ncbi:HdeD family acid-resistance protein [Maribacter sp. 2307ULW6-5]|uniref:HdeD family acid-resistance protein n=1 Tax=Maribacter sp. 2307ULW6-5 TaxID=3386275 RepID=UPI0039BCBF17
MATTVLNSVRSAAKNWWISPIIGALYIFAGFWVFRTPLASYISLSIIFSVLIFVSGIMEIAFAISNRKEIPGWGWYLTGGILDLIIGILLISNPVMTMAILPYFVGFWLLFRGIMAIGVSIQSSTLGMPNWGWLLASGIATLIFAFLVLANPLFGGLSIVYMTAFAFIFMGVFRIFLGFDLKKIHKAIK